MRLRATFEVVVERFDSDYLPFSYRLTWVKQREPSAVQWVSDSVESADGAGGIPGTSKMQVGDRWHFRITATFRSWKDYEGEWGEAVKIHSCKCFKKYRSVK